MKVTLEEAYIYLQLPYGATEEEVVLSYRNLACLYHPEKGQEASEKKFAMINCALQRVIGTGQSDEVDMDMGRMKRLYDSVFGISGDVNGSQYKGSSDSDYSDEEFYSSDLSRQLGPTREEIDKNAKELINEEAKEKLKVEKRKAKKKKRKEKKKLEKENEQLNPNHDHRSSDEEGLDPNAAFVKNTRRRRGENVKQTIKTDTNENDNATNGYHNSNNSRKPDPAADADINDVVIRSRQFAVRGNEMAQRADYPAAIILFTEAINLEPTDFRFYGNRSYCYDRTMQFDRALADAEISIKFAPEWPKGYFRKGRALAGLKLFTEAEQAFIQVLKLDKNCEEALKELSRVRAHQLIEMGFSPKQAELAILKHNSVQAALDSLLAGVAAEASLTSNDVYISDDESKSYQRLPTVAQLAASMVTAMPRNKNVTLGHPEVKKMDPSNPEGLTALWVGNVLPTVKETDLQKLFGKYGNVSSVRCLPEKFCAFVNFKSKEAAGKAMNALQRHEVAGQNLLIKFPDNPIQNGTVLPKATKISATARPPTAGKSADAPIMQSSQQPKVKGPVGNNGDECYFWRTTGCTYAGQCRWKHIPENRGVDKKPWQKVK